MSLQTGNHANGNTEMAEDGTVSNQSQSVKKFFTKKYLLGYAITLVVVLIISGLAIQAQAPKNASSPLEQEPKSTEETVLYFDAVAQDILDNVITVERRCETIKQIWDNADQSKPKSLWEKDIQSYYSNDPEDAVLNFTSDKSKPYNKEVISTKLDQYNWVETILERDEYLNSNDLKTLRYSLRDAVKQYKDLLIKCSAVMYGSDSDDYQYNYRLDRTKIVTALDTYVKTRQKMTNGS